MSGLVEGQLVVIGPQPEEMRSIRKAHRFEGTVAVIYRPEPDHDNEVGGRLLMRDYAETFFARPETLIPLSQGAVLTDMDDRDGIARLLREYNRRTV